MPRPPFLLYLTAAFAAAIAMAWLPVRLGGVHGYQSFALLMALAWLGLFVLGLVLYRRRGWWLLLASPPALFWLYAVGGALLCDGGRCG